MELTVLGRSRSESISEDTPTDQFISWTLDRFANQNMVMTTSFGMEGCALIDMYGRHGRPLTIIYLDTMFFFPETYALRDRMVERYPRLSFVNRGATLTPDQQAAQFGEELWKRDPDRCCQIRKVDPMMSAMADVNVWVTGLMRAQSKTRANTQIVEWDWKYQLLKVNPLVNWTRVMIWDYIRENNVPYNALHEQGYPTVGCTHCTRPVPGSQIGEYSRDGRWSNTTKTECGLHGGAGI